MKTTTRELVTLTVFGTLWGAVEMSLGALIHTLNLPLGGALLATGGLTIAMVGRLFVPKRGSTLTIGVIAMILKLFSIGNIVVGPMVGILAEALVVEIVLSLFGRPRRAGFLVAGALGVVWTLGQPFVTGLLIFGRDMFLVWLDLIDSGGRLLGLGSDAALWIMLILAVIHLALGALGGALAWSAGEPLRARLASSNVEPVIQRE
jgi:hypothetical protein